LRAPGWPYFLRSTLRGSRVRNPAAFSFGRNSGGSGSESRLDDEPAEFHRRVREGFLELARREPDRVQVIDATGSPEEVFARIYPVLPEGLR